MNHQVKQLWLEALRSGEYEQGTVVLKSKNAFCCLGVLCDIHRKVTSNGQWRPVSGHSFYAYDTGGIGCHLPPRDVVSWAELDADNPYVGVGQISCINDVDRLSFLEIADLIEKHL
jgi:hypothetical protein